MAEPITETALQVIVSMLEQITVANGFFTDIGSGYISTEPTQKPATAAPTYIVLTDTETSIDKKGNRLVNSTMLVTIEVIVSCDGVNRKPSNVARRARADVLRAICAPVRERASGLLSIEPEKTQRLIFDDERYTNSVVAQVTARAGLSELFPPATP